MEDKFFTTVVVLIGGFFMILGMIFGMKILYYLIPIVFIIAIGALLYANKKKTLDKGWITDLFNFVIMASLIIFILVGLGNCIRSCTSGGGDLRQQRIEMGLPPY